MSAYKVQQYKCRLVKDGAARVVARPNVPSGTAAAEVFRAVMRGLPHEEVWIGLLSAANDIRGLVRVSQGGLHGAALRPVDILRPVIASGEGAFLMAHNHPSGDPAPSAADVEMTRLLLAACRLVGIHFIDHVIVTQGERWTSMQCMDELGLEW